MNITIRKLIPVIGLTLLTSWLSGQSDVYKVYALKYECAGINSAVGSVAGASSADSLDVCYMIWFLKGTNGRNILVDAGFVDTAGKKSYVRPDLILGDINIKPDDITDIIITHPHFDHINGLSLFPKGKVWMQKKDFDYFVVDLWKDSTIQAGFKEDDVRTLIDVALDGRLNLVEGDNIEIIPGLRVFTGSTHTKENQYLLVNSESDNKVLLASDAIWFYLNLWRMTPIETYVMDPKAYVDAMKRMKTLVTDERFIIPGHDNLVFSKFEKVNDRVVMIK
jgi:glyoxylase-like metal-dependent hydrolase (beta-lactamase superfamily II)